MEILLGLLIGIPFGLAFVALAVGYATFTWGWIAFKFYAWFLLPIFPNLPHLTFMQACGLMFFIGLFKSYDPNAPKKEYKDAKNRLTDTFVALGLPWITLLIGYVFKCYFL